MTAEHRAPKTPQHEEHPSEAASAGFARVMELLDQQGFDVASYRKGTLWRRIEQRMALMSCSDWPRYVEHIETHPAELTALHAYLLVGVTQFFRDHEQWEHLEQEIAPSLIRAHADERKPIRIWSTGCSSIAHPS